MQQREVHSALWWPSWRGDLKRGTICTQVVGSLCYQQKLTALWSNYTPIIFFLNLASCSFWGTFQSGKNSSPGFRKTENTKVSTNPLARECHSQQGKKQMVASGSSVMNPRASPYILQPHSAPSNSNFRGKARGSDVYRKGQLSFLKWRTPISRKLNPRYLIMESLIYYLVTFPTHFPCL